MSELSHELSDQLQAARAGSTEALGQALQSNRGYLLAIAADELGDDLQVKVSPSDLVQQTFLEAVRDFDHFTGADADAFRAWLRQLLRNNARNVARDYRATDKRRLDREVTLDAGDLPLRAFGPTPSAEAVARETNAALEAALARLPAEYREVLTLKNKERLPFDEIGRRLGGRTANAARLLWSRAVERLRDEMGITP